MAAFDILAAAKARFLGASTTADQIGGLVKVGQTLSLAERIQIAKNLGVPCLLNTIVPDGTNAPSDTTSFASGFDEYEIVLQDILPSSISQHIFLQVSSGGVFQTTGYRQVAWEINDVSIAFVQDNTAGAGGAGAFAAGILLTALSNTNPAGPGISGKFRIRNPAGTSARKAIYGETYSNTSTGATRHCMTSGFLDTGNAAIDGFRITMSAGQPSAAGKIKIYGIP
jgi:hypothetical protein